MRAQMAWNVPSQMPCGFSPSSAFQAGFHHPGGFVGKGNGQNVGRRQVILGDQVGNAVGKDAGFARTGTGQHQDVAGLGGDRLLLLWI